MDCKIAFPSSFLFLFFSVRMKCLKKCLKLFSHLKTRIHCEFLELTSNLNKLSLTMLELKFIVNQTEIQTQSAGEILIRIREIRLVHLLRKPFSIQLSASEGGRID